MRKMPSQMHGNVFARPHRPLSPPYLKASTNRGSLHVMCGEARSANRTKWVSTDVGSSGDADRGGDVAAAMVERPPTPPPTQQAGQNKASKMVRWMEFLALERAAAALPPCHACLAPLV
jgi:hypothetical protein